jgi:hypothetical protein
MTAANSGQKILLANPTEMQQHGRDEPGHELDQRDGASLFAEMLAISLLA